jgi:hypothetical protein
MQIIQIESRLVARIQRNIILFNAFFAILLYFIQENKMIPVIIIAISNMVIVSMYFNKCKRCGTPLVSKTGNNFYLLDIHYTFDAGPSCRKCGKELR